MSERFRRALVYSILWAVFYGAVFDVRPALANPETVTLDSNANANVASDSASVGENTISLDERPHVRAVVQSASRTPSKRPVTPTRRPGTPSKRLVTPSKRPVTPSKRPVSPSKRVATPSKRPVTPSKRPASPTAKLGCPTSQVALVSGANTVSTCLVQRVANQRICGVLAENAVTYSFIAPNNATYVFTTVGSIGPSSTVLSLRDSSTCSQLACNVSYVSGVYAQPSASLVTARLIKGQRVNVVIGSRGVGCSARVAVSVTEYMTSGCKPSLYPNTPPLVLGVPQNFTNPCSGPYEPSLVLCSKYPMYKPIIRTFVAPSNGTYFFESLGNSPYVVAVRTEVGGVCPSLSCQYGFKPIASAKLYAGQRVSVVLGSTTYGGSPYYCNDTMRQGIVVRKAERECRVTEDCTSALPGRNTVCYSGGCLDAQCSDDDGCPPTQFCSNYRCNDEFVNPGNLSLSVCRFCLKDGQCLIREACCSYGLISDGCCDVTGCFDDCSECNYETLSCDGCSECCYEGGCYDLAFCCFSTARRKESFRRGRRLSWNCSSVPCTTDNDCYVYACVDGYCE